MKFRVNKGQKIPQLLGKPGFEGERIILKEGDELEGPPWWMDEFANRMTPLDEDGNPIEHRQIAALSGDLASAKAHEKVSILEKLIADNETLRASLEPELEKAKQEADAAAAEFEKKRAAREKANQERAGGDKPRPAGGQPRREPAVRKVAEGGGDEPIAVPDNQ